MGSVAFVAGFVFEPVEELGEHAGLAHGAEAAAHALGHGVAFLLGFGILGEDLAEAAHGVARAAGVFS